jgi:hypothetical protein
MVRTLTPKQKAAGWKKEKAQIKRQMKTLQAKHKAKEKAKATKVRKAEDSRMRGLGFKKSSRGTWG